VQAARGVVYIAGSMPGAEETVEPARLRERDGTGGKPIPYRTTVGLVLICCSPVGSCAPWFPPTYSIVSPRYCSHRRNVFLRPRFHFVLLQSNVAWFFRKHDETRWHESKIKNQWHKNIAHLSQSQYSTCKFCLTWC
jgi:hypothetical protein